MAKPLPKRFPLRPVWPRRNVRSPNANVSENLATSSWRSTNRSANCGQWKNPNHPPRKKNGRSYPKGNRARSRPTLARRLQRPRQDGVCGSGGYRDGGTLGHAPRWGERADPTAAISDAASRSRHSSLFLRSLCLLPRVTKQTDFDRSRPSDRIAALLLVPALSYRPISRRRRNGHRKQGGLSWGAPHAGCRRSRGSVRSRPSAIETARRPGNNRPSGGAYG